MWKLPLMNESARRYLETKFGDLINYGAQDPLSPIDPITYRTPEGDSCLHIAAARGDLRAVELLVDAGMDVNLQGDLANTPLHYARKRGREDVARYLISRGGSPQLVNELGEQAM